MITLTPEAARQLVSHWITDPIDQWRKEAQAARFIRPSKKRYNLNHDLAAEVELLIIPRLEALGLDCHQTTHKCPFDLWAGPIRIEVKAARWTQRTDRPQYGRFFAHLRNHQRAITDVVIFAVKNGSWHFFIIPAAEITGPGLAITSYHVEDYAGQWAPYLEAWPLVLELAKGTPARPRQLGLEGAR